MKTALQTILLASMLSCPVQAIEFTGTINGIFTDIIGFDPEIDGGINDEWGPNPILEHFGHGEHWTLTYVYESDTIDGTFQYSVGDPSGPTIRDYQGSASGGPGPVVSLSFTVENSIISDFSLTTEVWRLRSSGGVDHGPEPLWQIGEWYYGDLLAGSIFVSDPTASVSVPDSGPGILLSALVFAVLLARRFK